MRVLRNYIFNVSYQLFLILLPIVTLPYISRTLGPVGIGINSFSYSQMTYFLMGAVLGTAMYGQREIAFVSDDQDDLRIVFWEIEILSIFTSIISFFVMIVVSIFQHEYIEYLLIYSIVVLGNIFDISWALIGLEKFGVLAVRNFLIKLASVILMFCLVNSKNDTWIYVTINSLSILVSNVALLPYLLKIGFPKKEDKLKPFSHLKPTLLLFLPQISISLYTILNKIELGVFSRLSDVGFFDNSDKIVRLSLTVIVAGSTVIMPVITKQLKKSNDTAVVNLLRESLALSLEFAVLLVTLLLFNATYIVDILMGKKFLGVVPVLMVESVIIIPIAIANVIGNQFLIPKKFNSIYNKSVILGSSVNLLLSIPVIVRFGSIGAAILIIIAETVVSSAQIFYVRKFLPLKKMFDNFYRIFVAIIPTVLVMSIGLYLKVDIVGGVIFDALGVVAYFVCLFLLKAPGIRFLSNRILKK